jgi:hypothetical protein
LTVTSLQSLASGSYWQSAVQDNTANLFGEVFVGLTVSAGSGAQTNKQIVVYAYSDVDGTPHYTDGASGSEGTFTPTASPVNLAQIGFMNITAVSTVFYGEEMSLSRAFGGVLPGKYGIVIFNNVGAALNASGNAVYLRGVNDQGLP